MAIVRTYTSKLFLLIILSYTCIHSEAIRLLPVNPLQVVDKIGNLLGIREDIPTLTTQITNLIENGGIDRYNSGRNNEDKNLNVTQLIKKYSRSPEEHIVHTSDGYILTLIRIPSKGPPVFLFHGLTNSADDWVTAGPNKALPYLLAEQGYDVWLGNARGTKYSRRHERLSPVQAEFWDFSWDEIGRYDLPASIDYVLQVTGQKQLKYVGFSQGTTTFFVMCSEKPEYNDKISQMVALSPVAFMSRVISPIFRIFALLGPSNIDLISATTGIYEFVPDNFLTQTVIRAICGITEFSKLICSNGMYLLGGFNYPQLDIANMPMVFSHSPGGSSMKQFTHYLQEINSGKFRRFDHGMIQNLKKYGSVNPPDYPLEKITAPVALLYSRGDWLANYTDVEILAKKLPKVTKYLIPLKTFAHLDFLWAKDVKKLVYSKVLELLAKA